MSKILKFFMTSKALIGKFSNNNEKINPKITKIRNNLFSGVISRIERKRS